MGDIELINKRKVREKHFLKRNGIIVANAYDEDIHFLKDGKYEEIDNTLVDEGEYYTNKNNAYKVSFAKTSKDELMYIMVNNNYIKTALVSCHETKLEEVFNKSKLYKNINYKEVLDGIDLEYNIMPTKVKENIIIKNKDVDLEKIVFSIDTNMDLEILSNKRIVAKDNNRIYFEFDAPYMIDNNHKTNNGVSYKLSKIKEGNYLLKLNVDKEWLSDNDTKYPVMIDPTITNSGQSNSVYDTQISPDDDNEYWHGTAERLRVGVIRTTKGDVPIRSLFKFDLPTIGTGSQIVNATLNLVGYPEGRYPSNYDMLTIHQITANWTEASARWNNMYDKYNPLVEGIIEARASYYESENVIYPVMNSANITRLVRKWYTGTPNNGVMLKQNEEKYNPDFIAAFYSKDNSVLGANPKPILAVSYRNQNGIESYMDYQTQKFSIGSAYTNNYNGNLTTIFGIGSTIGGKMPVGLNLVYNTNDVILNNNVGYGLGYRLSLHQTIKEQVIDGVTYLEYNDEDGTLHYFLNKKTSIDDNGYNTIDTGNIYYDEDGLNLEITKNTNDYVLKDKNGNKMKFMKNGNTAYLSEVEDVYGNKNIITYNNKLITKVIDANNAGVNITYEDDKTTIISPDETVVINYLDGKLISIHSLLGITEFQYSENKMISKIIDIDDIKTSYEYYDQKPYKIKKVSEYGAEDTLGEYFEVSYGFDSTTITDSKQKAKNIIFNSQGSIVSVSGLKNKDDIKNAYGISSVNGTDNSGINPGYNNKLLSSEIPLKYVNNLLTNTSFEEDKLNFTSSSDVNISISDEAPLTGLKSLKAVSNSEHQSLSQNINVLKGSFYTFSAHIKNTNTVRLALSYINENNKTIESIREVINPGEEFQRHDVTIYYPETSTSNLTLKIYLDTIGTTYIDDVQLETGEVANNYNLLENSDFEKGLSDWQLSVQDITNGQIITPDSKFEIVSLNNGIKAVKTKLNPVHSVSMKKKFNISGKGGDVFNISFWYKNEGVDSNLSEHYGSRIYVLFDYVNQDDGHCVLPSPILNTNDESWQYVSNDFTAEKDYNSISLEIQHEYTANDFYMTNLNLFKDIRKVNYEYDEYGNVILSSGLNNKVDKFNYDKNNQLIKMTNPKGKNFAFEYDNVVTDRVINGISDMGISNEVKYDNNNNPIVTRIRKNHLAGSITDGLYQIRLKGTNKYIRNINNVIKVNNDDSHDLWKLEKVDEYFKIHHSILTDKYLTVKNSALLLDNYDNDNSLFTLTKNENDSYKIKLKTEDKYVKFNDDSLEISALVEDDYHFEFYFETIDSDLFIESTAEYTEDGKFIKSTTDSLFNKTTYDVDSNTGLTKSVTDARGNVTNYEYNDKKQIQMITSGDKSVVYEYSNKNKLSKIKHGKKEYNFNYDEFSNVKTVKIGDDITIVTNNYDDKGKRLLSSNYGNNQSISYVYDEFDRINKITRMDDIFDYKYGNNGDLVKIISNENLVKYTYDTAKRLTEYRFNDFKSKYNYDIDNNLINTEYNFGVTTETIENVFNDDDHIIKTMFDNNDINYVYDSLGRVTISNINSNFNINYGYVTNGNRTSFLVKSYKINNELYAYKYDKLNNITHISRDGNLQHKYYYDNHNQLIKENDYERNKTIVYKYDNVGNLLSKKVYGLNDYNLIAEDSYTYENSNFEDQLTMFNNDSITYDEIGNPVTIGNDINLEWINGKELNTYTDSKNIINYKYNHNGIRVSKSVNNVETKYYLEGKKIVYEKTGNKTLYYIRNSMDGLIGFKYDNDLYYYIKNIQDDVIGLLDSNYNVVAKYKYDSWGKVISITDGLGHDVSGDGGHIANINPFGYRSYYYDRETKLYYLNSRYYNPSWGRFLTIDSILSSNNDILSYNLYVYCSNNPVMNSDSSGKFLLGVIFNVVKKIVKKVKKIVETVSKVIIYTFTGKITSSGGNVKSKISTSCKPYPSVALDKKTLPNYSTGINNVLENNKNEAIKVALTLNDPFELLYFYQNVKTGGDWDYKQPDVWKQAFGNEIKSSSDEFVWNGYVITPEIFGNINYGYVGTSMGIPPEILFMGGGYAKQGVSLELFKGPYYGDDANDHCSIQFGIDLYNKK